MWDGGTSRSAPPRVVITSDVSIGGGREGNLRGVLRFRLLALIIIVLKGVRRE